MDFEDVYKLYYRDVYYFLFSLNGDPQEAEELTQETFYRALQNINKFKGECHLKSWLCQIGKNVYLSGQKKRKHLSGEALDEGADESHFRQMKAEPGPDEQYIQKEAAISIYRVLHVLEEPYKEVFTLRTLGELSYREIGEIFCRGEGWARVTYHRAKIKIREMQEEVQL